MDQREPVDLRAHAVGAMIAAAHDSDSDSDSAGDARSIRPAFLAELARAMQAAAEREREHIDEVLAKEAAEQVEKSRSRAAAETEELRRLAEEDVAQIKAWSRTEIERIRRDAERRTDERRKNLEVYLAKHESILATEIDGVDTAIRGYRAALDRFFDEFTSSTDPADIAGRAGSLPAPPDLDEVRATARVNAIAELANATDDARAGSLTDERALVADASAPSADDVGSDEPPSTAETGLGVMDPDAVGRLDTLADPSGELDVAAVPTSATAPPADALYVEAEESVEVAAAESADHSSAAVRLLRSIAPWTSQPDQDEPDRHSESG
jgi:hypothetical protein